MRRLWPRRLLLLLLLLAVLSLPPAHRTGLVPRGRLPLKSGHSVGYIGVRDRHAAPKGIVDMEQSVCVWRGSLERQSGTRFTLPARHRKSILYSCTRFTLPAHHRKSISYSCRLRAHLCSLGSRLRLPNSHVSAEQSVTKAKRLPATITLVPTGLVNVCPVKVLFSSRSTGITPPPPLPNFSWRA